MLCKAIISILPGQRKIVPLQVGNLPDIDRTSLAVKYHANIRETFLFPYIQEHEAEASRFNSAL